MSKKTLIISGGTLNEEFVLNMIKTTDVEYLIGVDRGNAFLYEHGCCPTHVVGDFDSLSRDIVDYYKAQDQVEVLEFDPVKDASDTEIAVRLALKLGSRDIVILGATGSRMDHVWANVQVLFIAMEAGVNAVIWDPNNRISIIRGEKRLTKMDAFGEFFSIFPLGGAVSHLSIYGAKYPLTDHLLKPHDSLCVSNQIVGEEAIITFPTGTVLLMETRDS